ncbi:TonB-dependent receptor [Rubidibacter lacunae]|uniref:TonB-dependent receptor n=1 Tax=Rubidibacter lacunae TaxID=582514 RepID=UPI0018DD9324|nr:TonB-dependent receptor [Rubidibacter lacunae]
MQVAITGAEAPPEVQLSAAAGGLNFNVIPSQAIASTDDDDAIQVVVSATRREEDIRDVPRSITVIDRETIEKESILSNDLSDLLGKLVPGFGPPNPEGRTRAQSLRGREALILIDGIPQNTNTSFGTEFSSIDPSAIERIEVIRGPNAVYGDGATGGTVNIITRKPADEGIRSTAAVTLRPDFRRLNEGGFGYKLDYGLSGREGRFDFLINGAFDTEQSTFDAEGDRIPPNGLSNENETLNFLAKAGIEINENQRLDFSFNIFNNDFDSEFIFDPIVFEIEGLQKARALRVGEIDYDDSPDQTVTNISLAYKHEDIINSQLGFQIYYRDTDLTQITNDIRPFFPPNLFPEAPRVFQTNLENQEFGTRLQIDTELSERFSLLWGVDFAREENEALFNDIDPDAFDIDRRAIVTARPTQTPFYTLENLGLFAQGRWDISDRWLFNGGLRYENIRANVDTYTASPFSPAAIVGPPPEIEGGTVKDDDVTFNAGIVYRANSNIEAFFNFSQGFSLPGLDGVLGFLPEGTDIENTIALESQKVNNFELGVRGDWGDVQFTFAGFYNVSNLGSALIRDPETGFTVVQRAPQRNYGIEFTVDWQPADKWRVGSILTWNEGDFDPDDDGNFVALSSVNVQPLSATVYIENETLPGWQNRLQSLFIADRDRAFEDEVDSFEVDGYVLVDFISTLDLGRNGRLEFGIENLLNQQYLPVSSQERIGGAENRRFAGTGRLFSIRYALDF